MLKLSHAMMFVNDVEYCTRVDLSTRMLSSLCIYTHDNTHSQSKSKEQNSPNRRALFSQPCPWSSCVFLGCVGQPTSSPPKRTAGKLPK